MSGWTRVRPLLSLRGSAGTVLTSLASVAFSFITSIALARLLLPSGRGELGAILLWPLLLPYLGMTGLFDAIVVFIARRKHDQSKIIGNGLAIAGIGSALLMVIGYILMPTLLANQDDWVVRSSRLLLVYMPLVFIADIYGNVLRANLAFGSFNLQRLVLPIGLPLGLIVLYVAEIVSVENVARIYLVIGALRLGLVLVLCARASIELRPRLDGELARGMLRFGGKVQVGSIAENANSRMGQILIAAWLAPAKLGLYVTAVGTVQLISILSDTIKISMLPFMATEKDRHLQVASLRRYFRFYWTISAIVVPLFALILIWFIPFVYGPAFQEAVAPAVILALGSILFGAKEVLGTGARAMGLPSLASGAEVLSLVVSFVFMLVLLRSYGLLGAAVATMLAHAASTAWLVRGMNLHAGIPVSVWLQFDSRAFMQLRDVARRS